MYNKPNVLSLTAVPFAEMHRKNEKRTFEKEKEVEEEQEQREAR